jgi:predicted PurR-regulated permease PerM
MKKEDLKKYIPIAIIVVLVFLSFLIVRDFIIPIISAFVLAYLIKPVYDKLELKIPKPLAAIICIILIILIIFVPLAGITGGIISQSYSILNSETISNVFQSISNSPLIDKFNLDLDSIVKSSLQFLISAITTAATYLPSIIISIIVIVLGIYYILLDWEKLTTSIQKYIPDKNKNKKKISEEFSQITKSLVYGSLLIALIEFIIAAIGFWLSGVKSYLLLPAIIAIFAFLPGGPVVVWAPLAIISLIQGNIATAIGVIVTGLILTIFIDTILRAKISGKGTETHPLTMFIGILGGVTVFGIFGFIIGPLILSYTIKIIEEIASH